MVKHGWAGLAIALWAVVWLASPALAATSDSQRGAVSGTAVFSLRFQPGSAAQPAVLPQSMVAETLLTREINSCAWMVFRKTDDPELVHSGVITDGVLYDLGAVCAVFLADACTIEPKNLYGEDLVKITGAFGAAYAPSTYYAVFGGGKPPQAVLRIENYNHRETDWDGDGVMEVFECSMFSALLHRFNENTRQFDCADLLADTGARQILLREDGVFVYYGDTGCPPLAFRYSGGRLWALRGVTRSL